MFSTLVIIHSLKANKIHFVVENFIEGRFQANLAEFHLDFLSKYRFVLESSSDTLKRFSLRFQNISREVVC